MADIQITGSLDDRDIVAAFNRMIKLQEKSEARFDALAKSAKKANETATTSMKDLLTGVGKWAAGIASVQKGYDLIVSSARDAMEETQKIGREFDAIFKKMMVLNNLKGMESAQAKAGVLKIAEDHGVTVEQAGAAADALTSQGFSWQDATGSTGSEFVKGMMTNGEFDGDYGEAAASAASYMDAMGMPKNEKSMRDIMQRISALGETAFQISNFSALTKEAGALKEHLSRTEQFAGMATLMDLTGKTDAEAATSLRAITLAMTSKKSNKKAMQALGKMGLKPDDIDLVGEDQATALERMGKGLQNVDEKDRDTVLADFVGQDHLAAFRTMMTNTDAFRKRMAMQGDVADYESKYQIAASTRMAGENRIDARLRARAAEKDQMDDLVMKQRRDIMEANPEISAPSRAISQGIYSTARFLGASQEMAHNISLPGTPWSEVQGRMNRDLRREKDPEMSEQTKAIKEQTQVLQGIRSDLAKPNAQQVTPPVLNSGKPTR